ncbi:MAG TPA: hypothetical protein VGC45_15855 [Gryllotalpicola sp.]
MTGRGEQVRELAQQYLDALRRYDDGHDDPTAAAQIRDELTRLEQQIGIALGDDGSDTVWTAEARDHASGGTEALTAAFEGDGDPAQIIDSLVALAGMIEQERRADPPPHP